MEQATQSLLKATATAEKANLPQGADFYVRHIRKFCRMHRRKYNTAVHPYPISVVIEIGMLR